MDGTDLHLNPQPHQTVKAIKNTGVIGGILQTAVWHSVRFTDPKSCFSLWYFKNGHHMIEKINKGIIFNMCISGHFISDLKKEIAVA